MKKLIILLVLALCLGACGIDEVEVPDIGVEVPDIEVDINIDVPIDTPDIEPDVVDVSATKFISAEDYLANTPDEEILAYFYLATRIGVGEKFYYESSTEFTSYELISSIKYFEAPQNYSNQDLPASYFTDILDRYLFDYNFIPEDVYNGSGLETYIFDASTNLISVGYNYYYIQENAGMYELGEVSIIADNIIKVELQHPYFTGLIITADVQADGVKFISCQAMEIEPIPDDDNSELAIAYLENTSKEEMFDYFNNLAYLSANGISSFTDPTDLPMENLFRFVSLSNSVNWYYDKDIQRYLITESDITDFLDQYFAEYNFTLADLNTYGDYDSETGIFYSIGGFGSGADGPIDIHATLIGNNIIEVQIDNAYSSGAVVKAKVTAEGVQVLSYLSR